MAGQKVIAAMAHRPMADRRIEVGKCRILISNDDGIESPGIKILEQIARELTDDVWVVAPDQEQSGASHSLTTRRPLRLTRGRGAALCGGRHADRLRPAGGQEGAARAAAGPGPVRHQRRQQRRRGHDLFGHRRGGDGGDAARHPGDGAEPGLSRRLADPVGHRQGVRRRGDPPPAEAAVAREHADQRQLSRACRRTGSPGLR